MGPGIRAAGPDAVIISPGPGRPEQSGVSLAVVTELNFAKLDGAWLSDEAGSATEEGEVSVID